ncbi:hypothetical protein TNCV_2906631 [Trichonephila clavipes]|nr:hypothetical protein TNCV_2906631 [Trichonephila clavipes]
MSKEDTAKLVFRAPPFWVLSQNYGFFRSSRLSRHSVDSTKFHCFVTALDSSVINCRVDILTSPPATDQYGKKKKQVIDYFAELEGLKILCLQCLSVAMQQILSVNSEDLTGLRERERD